MNDVPRLFVASKDDSVVSATPEALLDGVPAKEVSVSEPGPVLPTEKAEAQCTPTGTRKRGRRRQRTDVASPSRPVLSLPVKLDEGEESEGPPALEDSSASESPAKLRKGELKWSNQSSTVTRSHNSKALWKS